MVPSSQTQDTSPAKSAPVKTFQSDHDSDTTLHDDNGEHEEFLEWQPFERYENGSDSSGSDSNSEIEVLVVPANDDLPVIVLTGEADPSTDYYRNRSVEQVSRALSSSPCEHQQGLDPLLLHVPVPTESLPIDFRAQHGLVSGGIYWSGQYRYPVLTIFDEQVRAALPNPRADQEEPEVIGLYRRGPDGYRFVEVFNMQLSTLSSQVDRMSKRAFAQLARKVEDEVWASMINESDDLRRRASRQGWSACGLAGSTAVDPRTQATTESIFDQQIDSDEDDFDWAESGWDSDSFNEEEVEIGSQNPESDTEEHIDLAVSDTPQDLPSTLLDFYVAEQEGDGGIGSLLDHLEQLEPVFPLRISPRGSAPAVASGIPRCGGHDEDEEQGHRETTGASCETITRLLEDIGCM